MYTIYRSIVTMTILGVFFFLYNCIELSNITSAEFDFDFRAYD